MINVTAATETTIMLPERPIRLRAVLLNLFINLKTDCDLHHESVLVTGAVVLVINFVSEFEDRT